MALHKIYEENMVSEIDNYPEWIGTRELLQNGVRYIYETSKSKSEDGFDVLQYKKTKEDGTVVEKYAFKIVGQRPQFIS